MTLNEIEVGAACYLKEIRYPLVKVGIMILALTALNIILFADFCLINRVVCEVSIGFFIYISLTFFFEKKEVLKFREIFSN
jgi:hypothetical protein